MGWIWCAPLNSALGKLRQEDVCKFPASLVYMWALGQLGLLRGLASDRKNEKGSGPELITPWRVPCPVCPRSYFNPQLYKQNRQTKAKIVCYILKLFVCVLSSALLRMELMTIHLGQR